ncbi:MAG: hypothetical protein GF307_13200, partial [candidate division Zixibacteria bacterium]|nr:hypothetical protein [candidate division Zixibacteria bacterium]
MRKLLLTLALSLLLMSAFGVANAGDIDPGLEKVMESMTADQEISVLVYLNDQANLAAITDQMDSQNATL